MAILQFLFWLFVAVIATPLPNSEPWTDDNRLLPRQSAPVAITGITALGVQPRLEIRQLQQNTDQWNIFLLGLARFQATDQSSLTSYYQIAGIHGRPYIPWDNVQSAPGVSSPGYCMHLLNTFLSWHRPYLALFEQTLFQHMVAVVNEFPIGSQRQRYAQATISWRFPYWDWAAAPTTGASVYPDVLVEQTVTVNTPNGTATIPNPLFSYQFHPVSVADFYYAPFALWNETKRFPTSWDPDAVSQNDLLGPVFDNNRMSIQGRLYNLFTYYDNFTEFGNEAYLASSGVSNADSLESIHDVIHGILGSNGHMTYLDYSAFDPSFWLHHAMIDRIFALWQAIYPSSYVEPMTAIEQTFTINVGDLQNVTSPLEPFFADAKGDFWTAASSQNTTSFGYTYPELIGGNVSAVKAAINGLYGSSAAGSSISSRSLNQRARLARGLPSNSSGIQPSSVGGEESDGLYREYLANILSPKFALNSSYAIYLFMGAYDSDPTTWPTSPNLVGTHAVFATLSKTEAVGQIGRRQDSPNVQVTGSMPLTSMLLAKAQAGELADMTPATVKAYLDQNLRWRIATFDGSEAPLEDTDQSVTVVTAEVQPAASSNEFPKWSNFTELTQITETISGGYQAQ